MSRILLYLLGLFLLAAPVSLADGPTPKVDLDPLVTLLELVIDADADTARKCLSTITEKVQTGEVTADQIKLLRGKLETRVKPIVSDSDNALHFDAILLATVWKDKVAAQTAREILVGEKQSNDRRLLALKALIAVNDQSVLQAAKESLTNAKSNDEKFQTGVLEALGRLNDPKVAPVVLSSYKSLDADLKPKAIELLTARVSWSKSLLAAIGKKVIPPTALNANQVRKLMASRDEELKKLVVARWGTIRTERNPQREQVIASMRKIFHSEFGDARRGQLTFRKVCGQCHKIHGEGHEVGPDITGNGRASFEQLLSNVFDPSLVIGASYQARTVITTGGRVLTGLMVEDSQQRIALKIQGGKIETIPRDEVDEVHVSKLSMMPEGLEKQLTKQELIDLFAFLCLDRPPSDPAARRIPGSPAPE